MKKILKPISLLLACTTFLLTTGCASGGFKLTRQYAQFVNGQNIILRIILYIFTAVVFAVTMLIDMVIFNTIDFWEGRVSQGTYDYNQGDKLYHVRHEYKPGHLRHSTIQIRDLQKNLIQEVVLRETTSKEIELLVDGQLRTRVRDIAGLPIAAMYDAKGKFTGDQLVIDPTSATATASNR